MFFHRPEKTCRFNRRSEKTARRLTTHPLYKHAASLIIYSDRAWKETNGMKIGANIAALRRKKGLTQEQLAAQIGVSAPAVSKWETDTSCTDISLI